MENENAYDVKSKRLLSKKSILCNIMKECIPEYKNLTKEEIMDCIEDGDVNSEYIKGINTENINDNDSRINYDVLFTSKLPNSNERIGMYIDLETQNIINPGYHLIDRAIYYSSRLIDMQKGSVFTGSNYSDIRKVYSIWICTNPSNNQKDCINYYYIQEDCLKGNYHTSNDYKKINIIMLYIGDNYNYNLKGILEMLSLLFKNASIHTSSVVNKLDDDYDIILEEQEVVSMSDLSQGLIQQGRLSNLIDCVKNLNSNGYSFDDAFKLLKVNDDLKQEVLAKLKEKKDV